MPLKTGGNYSYFNMNAKRGLFIESKKDDSGNWVEGDSSRNFVGALVGINVREYKYEGRDKLKVTLAFKDPDNPEGNTELVSMSQNYTTASILNKLYNLENLTNAMLEISLYTKDGDENIRDSVRVAGEDKPLSWHFDSIKKVYNILTEIPRCKRFIEELNSRIDQTEITFSSMSSEDFYKQAADIEDGDAPSTATAVKEAIEQDDDEDDLPF